MSDGDPQTPQETKAPQETQSPQEPQPAPTFRDLLRANVKLVGVVILFAAVAFLIWRGLVLLFPDLEWLRIPER